jgi:hypothetical protein
MNFNFAQIQLGKKTLHVPRCYEYRGSIVPYAIVVSFFRLLNLGSHLLFKKVTMPRLAAEASA